MKTDFVVLIVITLFAPQDFAALRKSRSSKFEDNKQSDIIKELQQFLFQPKRLQNIEPAEYVTTRQVLPKNFIHPERKEQNLKSPRFTKNRRSENEKADQIYLLIPVQNRDFRKTRSNTDEQIKLDLARTDIPWDVPNSMVLDDGVRKIFLDMIKTAPDKMEKVDLNEQLSEEGKIGNNPLELKRNTNHFLNRINQPLFVTELPVSSLTQFESNYFNTTPVTFHTVCPNGPAGGVPQGGVGGGSVGGGGTHQDVHNKSTPQTVGQTLPKSPICINLQISNLIPAEMISKTKILNNSCIDGDGSVRVNILFYSDMPNNQMLNRNSTPLPTYPVKTQPQILSFPQKEIHQLLEATRRDNYDLNKILNITNFQHKTKLPPQNPFVLNVSSRSNNDQQGNLIHKNVNQNNNYMDYISKPLKELGLQSDNPSLALDNNSKLDFDHNEVNTSLALRTLLGLIQLIQVGNNPDIKSHPGQDNLAAY